MVTSTATPLGFWKRVDFNGPVPQHAVHLGACWPWTLSTDRKSGYGKAASGRSSRWVPAHRLAWRFTFGEIPEGLLVLHACDNGACVNPGHLFLGTHKDNSVDMAMKGRQGHQRVSIKDYETVRHLAQVGIPRVQIAKMYSVTPAAIWFILHPNYKAEHYRKAV